MGQSAWGDRDMTTTYAGGCACDAVRYEATAKPLFVHCCHCRRCQRQNGSAFALNAMIEASCVRKLQGELEVIDTPSESGRGQKVHRCVVCKTAVWSVYGGAGPKIFFLRVGSLDDPTAMPPDVHIFTDSKQPWVALPTGVPAVPAFYDRKALWPTESLDRLKQALTT